MALPVFVDIDGTLTTVPTQKWGPVIPAHLEALKVLIASGREVILWTGGGSEYARAFAEKHGLNPAACIGKPETVVDDNPTIRPKGCIKIVDPATFFRGR